MLVTRKFLMGSSLAVILNLTINPLFLTQVSNAQVSDDMAELVSQEPVRIQETNGTVIILPAFYDPQNTYPVLITLPFTGGTPAAYFRGSFVQQYNARTENPFIVVLMDVQGSVNDYPPAGDWASTINRYQGLVNSNLNFLASKYAIDLSRVAIAGSSLGGDLSWELSLRNPDLFQGTIIINSQSNRRDAAEMAQLAANNSRFFLAVSDQDTKGRLPEMRSAAESLAYYGVSHQFLIVPGTAYGASALRTALLMQGVDYVLFGE